MPIVAIDIDGLEAGVLFGNNRQVQAVHQQNEGIQSPNWAAFNLVTFQDAKIKIQDHKAQGNKIKAVYIQVHGGYGGVLCVTPGIDKKLQVDGCPVNTYCPNDDGYTDGTQLEWYYNKLQSISKIKNDKKREKAMTEFKSNEEAQKINVLLDFLSVIDDDATVIFGACYTGKDEAGDKFLENLNKLTNNRLNIVVSEGYVKDGEYYTTQTQNNKALDVNLSRSQNNNWKKASDGKIESCGNSLELNSEGQELYDCW